MSRRTLVKGAAWSVPVLMLAEAAPAFAGSPSEPTSLGSLLESSAVIDSQTVRQSSMYIADSTGITPDQLAGVLFDLTVIITYTKPSGSDSLFSLADSTFAGTGWTVKSRTANTIVIAFDERRAYLSAGFSAGYQLTFPNVVESANQRITPADGSISVTATGAGYRDGVKVFTMNGVIMGSPGNTTTAMPGPVYLRGPLFQQPP